MPHITNGFTASTAQSNFPQSFVAGMANPGQLQRQQQQQPPQQLQQQQPQQQPQPQQQQQQQQQRPGSAPGPAQLQAQMQSRPGSALGHSSTAGPISSMPMASQAAVKAQQSPSQSNNQMELTSPILGSDPSMGATGTAGQQQQQQQAAMMRAQPAPSANGPVMSNGKPALLRGAAARDGTTWAQGPGMVSACCAC